MIVALDKEGNRLFANSGEKYTECYCPACGEPLRHRKGQHNRPHFAHIAETQCLYGRDKDSKSAWHIRMQELFPKECIEVRFNDSKTGELKHIADVYLKDSNTVIEFQHSPIDLESFLNRTIFHLSEGRRIVWIYDESKEGKKYGRLKKDNVYLPNWIYEGLCYKWLYQPRKELKSAPFNYYTNFSVCVYYGDDCNAVHRIVSQEWGFEYVTLSVHTVELHSQMDTDEFFLSDTHWLSQSPWKEKIAERTRNVRSRIQYNYLPPRLRSTYRRRPRL